MIIAVAEEIFGEIEAGPAEPDGDFIYGSGLVNNLSVALGVNNLTKFPDCGPKFAQVRYGPGMQVLIRFYIKGDDQLLGSNQQPLLRDSL